MKIDIVYSWVDGNDNDWYEKKQAFLSQKSNYSIDATGDFRFFNNDELKYSLRSIENNAPWINNVFIITDNQVPQWLNTSYEKIRIIKHSDIIPKDKLPIFNSCAIEARIPYIEGLSEYFIYLNDDNFFWNSVDKNFFFVNEKPIFRVEKSLKNKKYRHLYGYTIQRAYNLARTKFDVPVKGYFPHHNADAYRKSLFIECVELFQEEFEATLNNKFRDYTDLQRIIVSYYSLAKGEAILKNTRLNLYQKIKGIIPDSKLYSLNGFHFDKILYDKSRLICLNETKKTDCISRYHIKQIMEEKFPKKSAFER